MVLGALPLIRFNAGHRGNTVADNTRLEDGAKLQFKARQTARYLNGLSAQDALVDVFQPAPDRTPRTLGRVALRVQSQTGEHFSSWICWGGCLFIAGALIVAPGAQRRWIAFLLLSAAIGWAESLATRDAGLSIHHSGLFFFQWYCGLALSMAAIFGISATWAKALAVAGLALLGIRSLIATTVCYADMLVFEPHVQWTNADGPLVADLLRSGVKRAIAIDWGISDVISARSRNRIAVDMEAFPLAGGLFQTELFRSCMAPDCVVVEHAPPNALLPGARALFYKSLPTAGIVPASEKTFTDTHGVPTLRYFYLRRVD
jgi:GNAT superfamily N-acetyltransferase